MRSRPEQPDPSQGLRRDVTARRARAGDAIGSTSAVPLALFGPCDPMIEAKLLDDATELLRHMSTHANPPPLPDEPPKDLPENRISSEEMTRLFQSVATIEAQTAPDLDENRMLEWLWILADIALCGHGLARDRATVDLDELLREARFETATEDNILELIVTLLVGAAEHDAERAEVHEALLETAQRTLAERGE